MNNENLDALMLSNVLAAAALFYLLLMVFISDIDIGGYQLLCVLSLVFWIISFSVMAVNNYEGSLWLRIFVTVFSCLLTLVTFISRTLTFSPYFNAAAIFLIVNYCIYAYEFLHIDSGDRY